MAAGLALVAPNSGGVTSYANNTNAWLAEPHPQAFAAAVAEIRAGGDKKLRKTAAARRTAEQYSWPIVTRRYLLLYQELNALTQGQEVELSFEARTYSTPGDFFGREIGASQ